MPSSSVYPRAPGGERWIVEPPGDGGRVEPRLESAQRPVRRARDLAVRDGGDHRLPILEIRRHEGDAAAPIDLGSLRRRAPVAASCRSQPAYSAPTVPTLAHCGHCPWRRRSKGLPARHRRLVCPSHRIGDDLAGDGAPLRHLDDPPLRPAGRRLGEHRLLGDIQLLPGSEDHAAEAERARGRRKSGDDQQQAKRPAASTASQPRSSRSRAPSAQWALADRPQRVQLGHRRNDLVVGVPELVAARAHILVAHLVDGDLDRRADERGDDLAVVDVVRP